MNQPQEQQIEEILTAIRKVCPELMELSFGCHVVAGGEPDEPREMIIGCPYEVRGTNVVNPYNLDDTNELFSIIGHDPHLGHLLRAIDSEHKGNYFIDTEGWLVRNNRLLREQLRKIKIDLTLSLRQNLETNAGLREFIHSLLKV